MLRFEIILLVWLIGVNSDRCSNFPDWTQSTNVLKMEMTNDRFQPKLSKPLGLSSASNEIPIDMAQATMAKMKTEVSKDYDKWYASEQEPGRRLIPFVLDFAYNNEEREVIFLALSEISRKTCLDFMYFESEETIGNADFLYFLRRTTGCQSWIGRQGGKQIIRLSETCVSHRVVLHEVMHVFGFFHQHAAPNRDDYIAILYENIEPASSRGNFEKVPGDMYTSFGAPYDFSSVLHYSKTDFAKKGAVIFYPKKEVKVSIGTRQGLSFWDTYKIRRHFGCKFQRKVL